MIKHSGARRVLFLVDRGNRQAEKEFQQYVTPDDGRKFTELYNVQRLTSNRIDPVAKVCISTIQRLYSMLKAARTPKVVRSGGPFWLWGPPPDLAAIFRASALAQTAPVSALPVPGQPQSANRDSLDPAP